MQATHLECSGSRSDIECGQLDVSYNSAVTVLFQTYAMIGPFIQAQLNTSLDGCEQTVLDKRRTHGNKRLNLYFASTFIIDSCKVTYNPKVQLPSPASEAH